MQRQQPCHSFFSLSDWHTYTHLLIFVPGVRVLYFIKHTPSSPAPPFVYTHQPQALKTQDCPFLLPFQLSTLPPVVLQLFFFIPRLGSLGRRIMDVPSCSCSAVGSYHKSYLAVWWMAASCMSPPINKLLAPRWARWPLDLHSLHPHIYLPPVIPGVVCELFPPIHGLNCTIDLSSSACFK